MEQLKREYVTIIIAIILVALLIVVLVGISYLPGPTGEGSGILIKVTTPARACTLQAGE